MVSENHDGGDAAEEPIDHEAPLSDEEALASAVDEAFGDIDEDVFQADDATADDATADDEASTEPASELDKAIAERDGYLAALQRLKAEFDNAKKRHAQEAINLRRSAAAGLVEKLLPVLDSIEAGIAQGAEGISPVRDALLEVLANEGLERVDPTGEPFDPERHEAVMHEPGDSDEPVVAETLRLGYSLNDKVLRPAMVKVAG